ncbi:hypothetical protein CABS01_16607 [Colletotrichum abscissum]|uniref:uncharacterized protein n=1 Tax=Colletotrichum abscissum TaxID=1671311 RepID=UPI0027D4C5F1|nr:uncharacterized protein CABS01_16607 [Colletotrichum abscissum]KAK1519287.1 hypothetical protein CABS01_16607 [Colletotrichum abscissum]
MQLQQQLRVMLHQTTNIIIPLQPIVPAPASGRVPMPAGGVLPGSMGEADQPTHVVGSQGRRGILPSAPGRPAATPAGAGKTKSTVIPVKDADGKFPCPHCTKTYLHAKHLKRHLLRHTGDRPYMCVLCRDTFSRSDILKRHFQKCSIRRGNPTGASHLSHPQAHGQDATQEWFDYVNMSAKKHGRVVWTIPVSYGTNNLADNDQSRPSCVNSLAGLGNDDYQDKECLRRFLMDIAGSDNFGRA